MTKVSPFVIRAFNSGMELWHKLVGPRSWRCVGIVRLGRIEAKHQVRLLAAFDIIFTMLALVFVDTVLVG